MCPHNRSSYNSLTTAYIPPSLSPYGKMNHTARVTIATTVAVTGAGVLLYALYRRTRGRDEDETDSGPVVPNITKYGKPAVVQELKKPGYFIMYNNQTKTPVYVVEKLTAESFSEGIHVERDHLAFHNEDAIRSDVIRATNADYAGSGYDRGHMAAAANHTSCEDATLETFTLSNAVPQFPACNRGNWKILENYARLLVKTSMGVYVYSGPLFIPQETGRSGEKYVVYQVIGQHTVAVPTHFFKIIVVERLREKPRVECFIVENAPNVKSLTTQDMAVDLGDIERWSGLVFEKLHRLV